MIPPFNASQVLPPFVGEGPGSRATMSPYQTTVGEFVRHFSTSALRVTLLRDLIRYRADLCAAGVSNGFQWIDGSFVENVEVSRNRAPRDIDLVTFARWPESLRFLSDTEYEQWIAKHEHLFDPHLTRKNYSCEAFFIDMGKKPELLIDDTRYWFGFFSHQRTTSLWKGMIQIPMTSNDADALAYLDGIALDDEGGN